MTMIIFATKSKMVAGTYFYDRILSWFPGGPTIFLGIVNTIAIPVIAIHLTELYFMDKRRLVKYNVKRGSGVWWKWMASCLIEGVGSFQRIDKMIKKQEKEKESKGQGGH